MRAHQPKKANRRDAIHVTGVNGAIKTEIRKHETYNQSLRKYHTAFDIGGFVVSEHDILNIKQSTKCFFAQKSLSGTER